MPSSPSELGRRRDDMADLNDKQKDWAERREERKTRDERPRRSQPGAKRPTDLAGPEAPLPSPENVTEPPT